ncbi:MAG: tRNA preQ1(34) S-adenosylmethionine ribosyltransferase-isomerase QueA [Gammaproteobacteria bacterium]|nr:tRNA preQ1(34) S-adenosylmethionine ribosyltransferase-isomerase QueA [Gammaproteobacteria bacterium]
MKLSDFDYTLPPEQIARFPLAERSASRLLCLNRKTGEISHQHFADLPDFLNANDLLIGNDTRVIPARLRGQKKTGGHVEILIERILNHDSVLAHVRGGGSIKPASQIFFKENISFEMIKRHDELFELRCLNARPVSEIIDLIGEMPLPPYLQRLPDESDKERYQTIFSKQKGSVAAPTAGLHFDENILQKIRDKAITFETITLHVGSGTFLPVRAENLTEHKMHAEYLEVSDQVCAIIRETHKKKGRVVAVGTTVCRSLETASRKGEIEPFYGDTDIFIYPGFQFHCVDILLTNFHLPRSTLLMLVAAFAGYDNVMQAYREAVASGYRFFSYGDAMLVY